MYPFWRRWPRAEWGGLAALTALAGVLRFLGLARQSIWVDETFSLIYAGVFDGLSVQKLMINLQGPFHALSLFCWSRLFGTGEAGLRSLQALAGTATVPALYWALRPTTRPGPRWLAVGFLAVSPFDIWYSQEIRGYAFLIFFVVLSMGIFVRLLEGNAPAGGVPPQPEGRRVWPWVAYTLVNTLGLLSNLSHGFLLVVQAAVLLFSRRARKALGRGALASWVATGILLSPWLVQFWQRQVEPSGALNLHPVPTLERVRGETTSPLLGIPYTFFSLSLGFSYGPSLRELHQLVRVGPAAIVRAHAPALIWAGLSFGVIAILGAIGLWRGGGVNRAWLCLAILPVLLTYGSATRNLKVLNPRYASAALPGYLLLLAEGVTRPRRRAVQCLLAGSLLLPTGISLAQYQTEPRYWKEDARGMAAYLQREVKPEDAVFIYGTDRPFQLYYWQAPGKRPAATYGDAWLWVSEPRAEQFRRFEELRHGHPRLFIVDIRPQEVDPGGQWEAYFESRYPSAPKVDFIGASIRVVPGGDAT